MSTSVKKRINFSAAEQDELVDLVWKKKNVLVNKSTDASTNREKYLAWEKVCTKYNSIYAETPRTMQQLQTKYANMKKELKTKHSDQKKAVKGTGGGPFKNYEESPAEVALTDLMGVSLTGLQNNFDDDGNNNTLLVENYEVDENGELELIRECGMNDEVQSESQQKLLYESRWAKYTPAILKGGPCETLHPQTFSLRDRQNETLTSKQPRSTLLEKRASTEEIPEAFSLRDRQTETLTSKQPRSTLLEKRASTEEIPEDYPRRNLNSSEVFEKERYLWFDCSKKRT